MSPDKVVLVRDRSGVLASRPFVPQGFWNLSGERAPRHLEPMRARRVANGTDTKNKAPRFRGKKQNRKDAKTSKNPTGDLQTVLHFLQSNPDPHSKADILTHTNLDSTTWPTLGPQLNNHLRVHRAGEKRGARYEMEL